MKNINGVERIIVDVLPQMQSLHRRLGSEKPSLFVTEESATRINPDGSRQQGLSAHRRHSWRSYLAEKRLNAAMADHGLQYHVSASPHYVIGEAQAMRIEIESAAFTVAFSHAPKNELGDARIYVDSNSTLPTGFMPHWNIPGIVGLVHPHGPNTGYAQIVEELKIGEFYAGGHKKLSFTVSQAGKGYRISEINIPLENIEGVHIEGHMREQRLRHHLPGDKPQMYLSHFLQMLKP
jgi:hypothetical protein